MPFIEQYVPADLYLEYKGVKIYHTYKGDDYEQGPRFSWFVLEEDQMEEDSFWVEDLDSWGVVKEKNLPKYSDETIQQVLKLAIDSGELPNSILER